MQPPCARFAPFRRPARSALLLLTLALASPVRAADEAPAEPPEPAEPAADGAEVQPSTNPSGFLVPVPEVAISATRSERDVLDVPAT